jgi:hypothetical protein
MDDEQWGDVKWLIVLAVVLAMAALLYAIKSNVFSWSTTFEGRPLPGNANPPDTK